MMPSTKIVVGDQLPDSDIQKKKILAYVKAYQTKFNHEPGTMVAYGADAAFIVINAIKKGWARQSENPGCHQKYERLCRTQRHL